MAGVRSSVGDSYVKTRYFLHNSIDLEVCIVPLRLELPALSVAHVAQSLGASGSTGLGVETGN